MEIFVNTKNLQKYGFNDMSFCFPHDKIKYNNDDKDDFFVDINEMYETEKKYELPELYKSTEIIMKKKNYNNPYENIKSKKILYQINSLLKKFNIYTTNNILKYILKTNDNIYEDKIIEYEIDIDLDRLSDHIVILFKINKSKFLMINEKNMLLKDLFDQVKSIINVNKNTIIYINNREIDYEDCTERKMINLFKNINYYDGVYNVEIKNKNVEITFCELLKNIQNNNIQPVPLLSQNITITNDILKILSKKIYNKVVEENKEYLSGQILANKLDVNILGSLKNTIETKNIQNYTKSDLIKILDQNNNVDRDLLNKIINDLFDGKDKYYTYQANNSNQKFNFLGLIVKYIYEDKQYHNLYITKENKTLKVNLNEEYNKRAYNTAGGIVHINQMSVDYMALNKLIMFEYNYSFLFENAYFRGRDYVCYAKNIIQIHENLFKLLDTFLEINENDNETLFLEKIKKIKNINLVFNECISYLTFVVINNSYYNYYQIHETRYSTNIPFCLGSIDINLKFIKNKFFWKYLVQNVKAHNIFHYCLCNYNLYGKYLYDLYIEEYNKDVANNFKNITNDIEKNNMLCIQNIFLQKYTIDYNDDLLASFLIFSSFDKGNGNIDNINKYKIILKHNNSNIRLRSNNEIINTINVEFKLATNYLNKIINMYKHYHNYNFLLERYIDKEFLENNTIDIKFISFINKKLLKYVKINNIYSIKSYEELELSNDLYDTMMLKSLNYIYENVEYFDKDFAIELYKKLYENDVIKAHNIPYITQYFCDNIYNISKRIFLNIPDKFKNIEMYENIYRRNFVEIKDIPQDKLNKFICIDSFNKDNENIIFIPKKYYTYEMYLYLYTNKKILFKDIDAKLLSDKLFLMALENNDIKFSEMPENILNEDIVIQFYKNKNISFEEIPKKYLSEQFLKKIFI